MAIFLKFEENAIIEHVHNSERIGRKMSEKYKFFVSLKNILLDRLHCDLEFVFWNFDSRLWHYYWQYE